LVNELLGYRYDVKKLHETVQYMQQTINLLNNDTLRLKSRVEERDDLLHEKNQNMAYLESELKKHKSSQDKMQKQNEGYQLRFNRKIKEIDILREQINHYKSDMYKMQIAMPYADKIESLQMEVNNLKQSMLKKGHSPLVRTSSAPMNISATISENVITSAASKESVSYTTQLSTSSSLLRSSLFITDDDASVDELMNSFGNEANTNIVESPSSTPRNRRYSLATKF